MLTDRDIGMETLDRISRLDAMNGWIVDVIRPYLGARVLEVGCGIGNLTGAFLGREVLVSVDVRADYIERVQEKFGTGKGRPVALRFDIESDPLDGLREYAFDTVVCLNVLEHLQDDGGSLARMRDLLVPGGRVLLLVPALPALYGSLDRHVEHQRRYGRSDLDAKLRAAGFRVETLFFMHLAGALGWWLNSRVLRSRILPEGQIGLYDRLVPLFRWAEERVRPPVGLSLVAVGERPRGEP